MGEHMATKLMRPLPLQPPFVIMDKLLDILLYTAKFSSFVRNRLRRYGTQPELRQHALHLPVQMDFWIIPQCAAEPQIEEVMKDEVISDYNDQCELVPFKVGNQIVGDIGDILKKMEDAGHCHYVSMSLDEGYTLFEKRVDKRMIGAKHICNGHMFATSFHLFQIDKIRAYFMSNGYAQRFTQYEYQYYWPRLFMKDPQDGTFQDEEFNENIKSEHCRDFDAFFNIEDTEHMQFKRYTMNHAEEEDIDGQ